MRMPTSGYAVSAATVTSAATSGDASRSATTSGCDAKCSIIVGSVVGGVSLIAVAVIVTLCICYCCCGRRTHEHRRELLRGASPRPRSLPPPSFSQKSDVDTTVVVRGGAASVGGILQPSVHRTTAAPPTQQPETLPWKSPSEGVHQMGENAGDAQPSDQQQEVVSHKRGSNSTSEKMEGRRSILVEEAVKPSVFDLQRAEVPHASGFVGSRSAVSIPSCSFYGTRQTTLMEPAEREEVFSRNPLTS